MATWWLVTWTTYASWLPGDPRGFQTWRGKEYVPPPKRYAKPEEETYNPEDYQHIYNQAQEKSEAVVMLTEQQRKGVFDSLVDEIRQIPIRPAILAVGDTHVHLLAQFGKLFIRPVIGRLKSRATRDLKSHGFDGKRPWTKNCHMVSKDTPEQLRIAYNYIERHGEQNCEIYAWLALETLLLQFE